MMMVFGLRLCEMCTHGINKTCYLPGCIDGNKFESRDALKAKELEQKLAAAKDEIEKLEIISDSKVEESRFIEVLKERDEERAHNAVLIDVLENLQYRGVSYDNGDTMPACLECGEILSHSDDCPVGKVLSQTPSDSAAKVQKLVDALVVARKYLPGADSFPLKTATEVGTTVKLVDNALTEWRGEKQP